MPASCRAPFGRDTSPELSSNANATDGVAAPPTLAAPAASFWPAPAAAPGGPAAARLAWLPMSSWPRLPATAPVRLPPLPPPGMPRLPVTLLRPLPLPGASPLPLPLAPAPPPLPLASPMPLPPFPLPLPLPLPPLPSSANVTMPSLSLQWLHPSSGLTDMALGPSRPWGSA